MSDLQHFCEQKEIDFDVCIRMARTHYAAETGKNNIHNNNQARIIVDVQGGNVQAVYSNNPEIEVLMCDWDNAACDDEEKERCDKLAEEEKIMKLIY